MPSSNPSIAELRAVCQPPGLIARYSGEHWAGRLYGRRVSIYVTWLLVRTGLSANVITFAMAVVGVCGALLFALQGPTAPIEGMALIQLYLLLDCSDGEVARWRQTTGATGIFIDRLGHYLVEGSFFAALGIYAARVWSPSWIGLGMGAALFHFVGKVETDLVHVARAKAGLPVAADEEAVSVPSGGLGAARRLARMLPLYRLTGAIEASLIVGVLRVFDAMWWHVDVTLPLVAFYFFLTALIAGGHFVMILASKRLR
ncbi:MAG TPA: CDP-alcohol phosphatidyltransferase family protein [Actinomycetota bacterium]